MCQGLRSILQLAFGLIDDFMPRLFSDFEALFGKLRSLSGAFAGELRASLRFPDLLFHPTKKFGSLKHKVQHRPTVITWQRPRETQQIVFTAEGCIHLRSWRPGKLSIQEYGKQGKETVIVVGTLLMLLVRSSPQAELFARSSAELSKASSNWT